MRHVNLPLLPVSKFRAPNKLLCVRRAIPPYPPHGCAHLAHPSAQCAKKKNGAFGAHLAHLAHPWMKRGGRQWLKGATKGNTETNTCRDRLKKEVKDANP